MMHTTLDNKQLRQFGITLAMVFIGVFGSTLPLLMGKPIPGWPWYIGISFLLLAVATPHLLRLVYQPWMKLGHILGWINTRIILSAIFFVLITPMGIIMRLWGYDPMQRYYDKKLTSYRTPSVKRGPEHMEKPF